MISSIGIILPLFLCLVLIGKKEKKQADLVLLMWLITIAAHLFLYHLQRSGLQLRYPFLLGWLFPLPFLQWMFMYLYISALTSKKKISYSHSIHLVPFLISVILFSHFYFLPGPVKVAIFKNQGKGFETQMAINFTAIILIGLVYLTLSALKLTRHKRSIKSRFSYSEKINLKWLQYILAGMTIIFSMILFMGEDDYIFTPVVCFVVFMGYYGIRQVGVFSQNYPAVYPENKVADSNISDNKKNTALPTAAIEITAPGRAELSKSKYQKSTLTEVAASEIYADLKRMMQNEQLYKNPALSLDELAKNLNVLPNHLSQVINSKEQRNFYDFINQLRIEHFIAIVSNPANQQFTLLSLAFEVGFNSKTSFNRNFKKVTGLTPSQFLKKEEIKVAG